ncbi:MucBP domain-containing protein [Listeria seeligeri]|uniref:MucBP domain-containing protein n=1 Tax=Listeria seeligeri TaxID=1640 RepID=UPI001EF249A1|nr:MucBP domain-containing protein [Listeria seeligeri]
MLLTTVKNMYRVLWLIVGVVLCLCLYPSSAFAATFGDFEYTVSGNDATITDYTGQNTSVTIPSTIGDNNEYTVTSIGATAFAQKSLTDVTIPNTVVEIGTGAFTRNYLTQIALPDSVQTIGENAFSTNEITEVIISKGLTDIPSYAFFANKLKKVSIPANVTSIQASAFENNSITDITIQNPNIQLNYEAFAAQTTLGSLIVPSDNILPLENYLHFQDASGQLNLDNATVQDLADGVTYDATKEALVFTEEPVESTFSLFTGTNRLDSYYDISEYGFSGKPIVLFRYTKPVIVTYEDESGNEIASATRLDGSIGDPYTSKAQTIDGYTLKQSNGNTTGVFTNKTQNVTYVYEKNAIQSGMVTVNYQDESGNDLAKSTIMTGEIGASYQTESKVIDGYTLKKVEGKESGEFGTDSTTVTYIYEKISTSTDNGIINDKDTDTNVTGNKMTPSSNKMINTNTSDILPSTGDTHNSLVFVMGGLLMFLSVGILFRKY